jgi:hypothetical protein
MTPQEQEVITNAFKEKMNALYHLAQHIATLSSGALAISVTFTKTGIDKCPIALWFLRGAWIGFILAVFGFVLIHLARIASYDAFLDNMRAGKGVPSTVVPPWYFHIGRHLLIVGFIFGLLFLAIFGMLQE